ncbi:hypothetical protein [Marinobacter sp. P4B1]|uniref:hypothetical protein n=1 Tax=Marinobacter sp. P4B1 TaxID=1119533 RepID=UPI00071C821F|nr:hypothetical protein [Marinobacter sp. P4B1]KRW83711.1 hypothetical protein AQ621_16815 [Marinobacter sp. P4B1]
MPYYVAMILSFLLAFAQPSSASEDHWDHWLKPVPASLLAGTAWDVAARKHGIDDPWLLFAVTLEESGRIDTESMILRPWPFTLHRNGQKLTFTTKSEAIATIEDWESSGYRNYDIGPLQINRHWHGDRFDKLAELLDVAASVDYAASIIAHAHRKFGGSLVDAAGRYRSWSNSQRASEYAERIETLRIQLPK